MESNNGFEYNVGDIVSATYGDFNGEKRVGLFLIVYNEKDDRKYNINHTNLTAIKITTNNMLGNMYVVRLYKGESNLERNCFVNCSKIHTFTKEQVYKKIGQLSPKTMTQVFKELNEYNNELSRQVLSRV